MKKPILRLSQCALLVTLFMAGAAQAQSIIFSGDASSSGNVGASFSTVDITIGDTGTGALVAADEAIIGNSGQAVIGNNAGSSGTATMSVRTQWTSGNLTIANSGTGALNVQSGSVMNSNLGYIGRQAGSAGTVTIEGAGSSWLIFVGTGGDFWIGDNGGSGTLRVLDGGVASTAGGVYTSVTSGSASSIEVDGSGSALTGYEFCALGMQAPTTVQVTNGGLLDCTFQAYLAHGSITLRGEASSFKTFVNLDIGYDSEGSNGVLNIGEGSSVEVGQSLRLPYTQTVSNSTGTVNIEGSSTPGAIQAESLVFGDNNAGSLNFNHTDTSGNYQFATPVSGPGQVMVNAAGTTTLSGNNVYTGNTGILAGVLRAGSATGLSSVSDISVAADGTLDTDTFSPTLKSLRNAGTVTMLSGGTAGVLTISSNYVGEGGSIALNTALGDDGSATERLVVNGDTSGSTALNISNLGGAGAPTTGNGILVVEVAGASNGVFSLPAPGYLEVGGFRYALVKIGNNWYLSNSELPEASSIEASVACTPSQLGGSAGLVATCTVSLNAAPLADFPVNLNLPATSPRYTTTCGSPIVVAANATQASCTITAVASTSPDEGDIVAELSIAPPTVPDAYAASGAPAQVQILGKASSGAHAVPTLGTVGLVSLVSVMGLIGLRRSRKSV